MTKLTIIFKSGAQVTISCENYEVVKRKQDSSLYSFTSIKSKDKDVVYLDPGEVACILAEKK